MTVDSHSSCGKYKSAQALPVVVTESHELVAAASVYAVMTVGSHSTCGTYKLAQALPVVITASHRISLTAPNGLIYSAP